MRIHTRLTYQWRDEGYVLVDEEGFDYHGSLDLCKGASDQQNALAASQTAFTNTLQQDTATQFANQQAIQSSINQALEPVIAAGPNQFGYNQAELNNLNSNAVTGVAQSFANAKKGLQNTQADQGGGNALLPSGVQQQQNEVLASQGAGQEANELLGIQNAGYQQGYNTFENAIGQTQNLDNSLNATGFAGQANTSGADAGNTLETIQKENAAASPLNAIGGVLGGAASTVVDGMTGDLGTSLSKQGSGNWGF
jgi:hypothetical protein